MLPSTQKRAEREHAKQHLTSHKCCHCDSIILKLSTRYVKKSTEIPLGVNAQDATRAAEDGCHFFQLVLYPGWPRDAAIQIKFKLVVESGERIFVPTFEPPLDEDIQQRLREDWEVPEAFRWLKECQYYLTLWEDCMRFRIHIYQDDAAYSPFASQSWLRLPSAMRIWNRSRTTAANLMPPERDMGSASAFSQAKSWLQHCTQNHSACLLRGPVTPPRRLLHLTPDGQSVKVTQPGPVPYVALSYCWGGDQPFKLTRATQETLENGVSVLGLSPTIQDAVSATAGLGFCYLWVDALCIVQDDFDDKYAQIPKMADIYRGAEFTIAAAKCASSEERFLTSDCPPMGFSIGIRTARGRDGMVLLLPDRMLQSSDLGNHIPRLHHRGWTFQEVLFSRRYLHYGPSQLDWSCMDRSDTVNRRGGPPFAVDFDPELHERSSGLSKVLNSPLHGLSDSPDSASTVQAWWSAIANYSSRQLTVPEDKLNAVASLAEALSARLDCRYFAGLWGFGLEISLCWGFEVQWSPPKTPQLRPPYRAPSWSWASIDGRADPAPFHLLIAHKPEQFETQILEVDTQPLTLLAPFSTVTSGYLVICGPLRQQEDYHIDPHSWCITLRDAEFGITLNSTLDAQEPDLLNTKNDGPVPCLWLLRMKTTPRPAGLPFADNLAMYLLLAQAPDRTSFCRKGLVSYMASGDSGLTSSKGRGNVAAWEDSFVTQTITII